MEQENMERMYHFSHPHQLVLTPSPKHMTDKCGVCYQSIKGENYTCNICRYHDSYSLHISCAKFSVTMNHPIHPHHSLVYFSKYTIDTFPAYCGACGGFMYESFAYICMDCKFSLHLKCAALTVIGQVPQSNLPNIKHQHSVLQCVKTPWDHFQYKCGICEEAFEDDERIYMCQECHLLMHHFCIRLPYEIRHPFHLEHPLRLIYEPRQCSACFQDSEIMFQCSVCYFTLDIHCANLMPMSQSHVSKEGKLSQPLSRCHPLIECQSIKEFRRRCSGCNQPFGDSSIHVCLEYGTLLDSLCADSPPEISHPLHPQHQLIFGMHCSKCSLCNEFTKYSYKCMNDDNFFLDLRCAKVKPNFVPYGNHEHGLAYFSVKFREERCCICGELCNEFFFGCLECNTYFHDHCFPSLPQTIKHECHCDPMTLVRSPIIDYPDQDVNEVEFYCFSCEDLRELKHPTYYCAECPFVAHVHCVISEVMTYLQSQPKRRIESGETCSNPKYHSNDAPIEEDKFYSEDDSEEAGLAEDNKSPKDEFEDHDASPLPEELDDEIVLLKIEVDALAAELSRAMEKINELEERDPKTAVSLANKLLDRIYQKRPSYH